jgi:hypothetical protein
MTSGKEAVELIEKNVKYVTAKNAKELSRYFMMAISSGHKDYLEKFYVELQQALRLPEETTMFFKEDSRQGTRGTEVLIMERMYRRSKNKTVSYVIETALAYNHELEAAEARK